MKIRAYITALFAATLALVGCVEESADPCIEVESGKYCPVTTSDGSWQLDRYWTRPYFSQIELVRCSSSIQPGFDQIEDNLSSDPVVFFKDNQSEYFTRWEIRPEQTELVSCIDAFSAVDGRRVSRLLLQSSSHVPPPHEWPEMTLPPSFWITQIKGNPVAD